MIKFIPAVALALSSAAFAQDQAPEEGPKLTLQQSASLRCGVVFGTITAAQDRGDEDALAFPPMKERGREFFVRTMAKLMDDENLDRDQVKALVMGQIEEIVETNTTDVADEMPACMLMLEAAGL